METIFTDIVKSSPLLGLLLIFWFYQRKDYRDLIERVQKEGEEREKNYQNIIKSLTNKLSIIEDVKKDIEEVKVKIFK